MAGIGDSLIVGNVDPYSVGGSHWGLSTDGSLLGAIFYIIVWNLIAYLGMKFLYFKGFEVGAKLLNSW